MPCPLLGDDRERREARAALPSVASRVRTLLGEWEETHGRAVSQEKQQRELARVEIPGLSEAAQAFLTAYRAGSLEAGEALIAGALRTEEGRSVMGEFQRVTEAAAKREGASQAGVWKYAFLGITGMDGERGRAPGETVVVIRGIDRDQGRIFGSRSGRIGASWSRHRGLGWTATGQPWDCSGMAPTIPPSKGQHSAPARISVPEPGF